MNAQPPMERLAQEPEPESDGASFVVRLGLIIASGVAAAVVSSLPAVLRARADASASRLLEQWVVLSAVSLPVAVAAVAIFQRARVGVRLLAGERLALLSTSVLWWCVIELGLLSLFGAVLRHSTHHHALAGVTFAVFAVGSGIFVALVARRTALMLARGGGSLQKLALAITVGCAFASLVLVGVRASRAEGMLTPPALIDCLAFVIAATIASSRWIARGRPMAIAGVPVAVLLVVLGLSKLGAEPQLKTRIAETAPMHGLVIELLGRAHSP
ncbi:MAG TPA: hypothetical protein VM580_08615 [Labilithrix sp.]|nr:hypothetical protein [Labilithrix sp.]